MFAHLDVCPQSIKYSNVEAAHSPLKLKPQTLIGTVTWKAHAQKAWMMLGEVLWTVHNIYKPVISIRGVSILHWLNKRPAYLGATVKQTFSPTRWCPHIVDITVTVESPVDFSPFYWLTDWPNIPGMTVRPSWPLRFCVEFKLESRTPHCTVENRPYTHWMRYITEGFKVCVVCEPPAMRNNSGSCQGDGQESNK